MSLLVTAEILHPQIKIQVYEISIQFHLLIKEKSLLKKKKFVKSHLNSKKLKFDQNPKIKIPSQQSSFSKGVNFASKEN